MQGMITRNHLPRIEKALDVQAGVVLLGPRQVGKTTLAQDIALAREAAYLGPRGPSMLRRALGGTIHER